MRLDSTSASRLTLTRSYSDTSRDTTPDVEYEDSRWLSSDAGSRLSTGELVPGTRFKIIRWIGEGGMGQVFEAVHVDIQRLVALKVLKSSLGLTPDLCATFLAEARACAKIESRFVVSVLDFGVLPDDRPFFAMELLAQDNLHTEIARGWMSLERVIPILRQICKALAAIHKAGLVHRDLKPENVILQAEDGRVDTVRVVDFGIAAEPGAKTRVAGTPTYMAPEQIRGHDFDPRLDIYSLGCMAYEMLSGGPPFEGSLFEVFEGQLDRSAPPISRRRDGLPPELDAVLLKCVEKAPEDRWANVHELEAALCEVQILAGFVTPWDDLAMPEIGLAERESLIARMPRATAHVAQPSRKRWWVGLGFGVMAIGLVVGVLLRQGDDEPEQAGVAAVQVVDAPVDAHVEELSDAVRLAASRAYWVYPPIADPDQPTALDWIRELEAEQGPLAAEAQARGRELRAEIAATLVRFGDKYWGHEHGRSFAVEYYALALIFMPTEPRALERSAITPAQLADVITRAERGEFTRAELRAAEVMTMLADEDHERMHERIVSLIEDDETILSVRTRESLIEVAQLEPDSGTDSAGVQDDPDAALESSAAVGQDSLEVRDPATASTIVAKAERALTRGDRSKARQLFNEAISHDNRSVAALSGLAGLHFDAGEYGTALRYARKASRLRPKNGDLHILVGDCYLKVLRYPSARAAYQEAAGLRHPRAAERIHYLDGLTR